MSDEKKGGFFDRLKKAVDQALVQVPEPAKPAAPPARQTAPIKAEPKRTDALGRTPATAQLGTGAKRTAPLPEETIPEMPDTPPEEELSPRRLAMIDDFMTGKAKLDQMKDPTFMYKIVSDERAYQTQLLFTLQEEIQALRPDQTAEAEALQGRIRRSQAIVTNLFKVLKYITGKKGRTGGTDFLSEEK
jgi:3-oxoacyl-ACP reductase-like protein